jgi:glucokinase
LVKKVSYPHRVDTWGHRTTMTTMLPAGSPTVLRSLNRSRILRLVRSREEITRVDLARQTGLSKPTVNKIVADLVDEGMLREIPLGHARPQRRSGPRPMLVAFRPEFGYVIGVDVGANKLLVQLADLSGRVIATQRQAAEGPRRAARVMAELRRALDAVLFRASVSPGAVKVVVIGTPGVVDPLTLRVTLAPQIPGWEDIDIAGRVGSWMPSRVLVDTEVQLSMLAERWHGAGRGEDNLVYINVGIGIGAGILLGGERYRGATGAAGEIGYLPITPAVDADPSGGDGFGSFERAAGGAAYARLGGQAARGPGGARLMELAGDDADAVDAETVFRAAAEDDPAAVAIVDELVGHLARGVAAVAAVVDPALVVIGGGLSRAGEPLRARLERGLRALLPRPPRIVLSSLGEEAVALGAVTAAIEDWELTAYAATSEVGR